VAPAAAQQTPKMVFFNTTKPLERPSVVHGNCCCIVAAADAAEGGGAVLLGVSSLQTPLVFVKRPISCVAMQPMS
jgi:hypothetical protein